MVKIPLHKDAFTYWKKVVKYCQLDLIIRLEEVNFAKLSSISQFLNLSVIKGVFELLTQLKYDY